MNTPAARYPNIGLEGAVRKALLEMSGFAVLIASDGPAGLAIAEEQPIDAVILDYEMPGMNGEEVARNLREQHCEAPILLFSGALEALPDSLRKVCNSFLAKCEGPTRLIAEVEKLTFRRRMSSGSNKSNGCPTWAPAKILLALPA